MPLSWIGRAIRMAAQVQFSPPSVQAWKRVFEIPTERRRQAFLQFRAGADDRDYDDRDYRVVPRIGCRRVMQLEEMRDDAPDRAANRIALAPPQVIGLLRHISRPQRLTLHGIARGTSAWSCVQA